MVGTRELTRWEILTIIRALVVATKDNQVRLNRAKARDQQVSASSRAKAKPGYLASLAMEGADYQMLLEHLIKVAKEQGWIKE